ncbi:CinA family protein [Companilactobacillus sp. DQM5]|uniref:CinA family protein n=1 Tax=Companilactobacillus sp. DQM5 TaxID=3463359 RepID=UPI00405845A4
MTNKLSLENIENLEAIDDQIYNKIILFTVKKLIENKLTITAAESLTAGMFLSSLADVSGASQILEGGFVTYSNRAKQKILNIDEKIINEYGVVSEVIAELMAQNSKAKMHSLIGIGLTGVAGPNSLEGKKAGTVYIGYSDEKITTAYKFNFLGDRKLIRKKAVTAAMLIIQKNSFNH